MCRIVRAQLCPNTIFSLQRNQKSPCSWRLRRSPLGRQLPRSSLLLLSLFPLVIIERIVFVTGLIVTSCNLGCAAECTDLTDEEKVEVFEKLVKRVINARFAVEHRVYNERNTSRTSRNRNEISHRGKLKVAVQGNEVKFDINRLKREH